MGKRKQPTYKTNPFLEALILKGKWKTVSVGEGESYYNRDGEKVLLSKLASPKFYDDEEFVKVYREGVMALLSLKTAGQKVAKLIVDRLFGKDGIDTDKVILKYELLEEKEQEQIKKTAFFLGINECIELKLLAQSTIPSMYFINPAFIFNGDRLKLAK